jgi:hypothetical protein
MSMTRFAITEEAKKYAHNREFARTLRMAMRDLYKFGLANEQILGQLHIAIVLALAGLDLNTPLAEEDSAALDEFTEKHKGEIETAWKKQKEYIEVMVRTELRIKTAPLGVSGLSGEEFDDLLLGVYGKI